MVSINDMLPKRLQEIVERRSKEMHFPSPLAYIEALIEQDAVEYLDPPNLAELIQKGLDSGPGVIVDEHFWAEQRRELEQYIASKCQ